MALLVATISLDVYFIAVAASKSQKLVLEVSDPILEGAEGVHEEIEGIPQSEVLRREFAAEFVDTLLDPIKLVLNVLRHRRVQISCSLPCPDIATLRSSRHLL